MADNFPFGNDEVKKQLKQFDGDAKELINGAPLDSDDGGKLVSASDLAKGKNVPGAGDKFEG